MLRNWEFDIDKYKVVAQWMNDNPDATANDAALWWLNGNEMVWSGWVTADAGSAISAALSAGETADGWPTE